MLMDQRVTHEKSGHVLTSGQRKETFNFGQNLVFTLRIHHGKKTINQPLRKVLLLSAEKPEEYERAT
jgi:hypothetical protein